MAAENVSQPSESTKPKINPASQTAYPQEYLVCRAQFFGMIEGIRDRSSRRQAILENALREMTAETSSDDVEGEDNLRQPTC